MIKGFEKFKGYDHKILEMSNTINRLDIEKLKTLRDNCYQYGRVRKGDAKYCFWIILVIDDTINETSKIKELQEIMQRMKFESSISEKSQILPLLEDLFR